MKVTRSRRSPAPRSRSHGRSSERETFSGLPGSVQVGLAVTSHVDDTLATATFDNLSATPIVPNIATGMDQHRCGRGRSPGSGDARRRHVHRWRNRRGHGDTADAFHFAYVPLSGDFDMWARVTSLDGPDPWSKAGLMIRESLDPAAAHHFLLASGQNGLAHQWRPSAGGVTLHEGIGSLPLPAWFRIERHGDTLTFSYFVDGGSFTIVARRRFQPARSWLDLL